MTPELALQHIIDHRGLSEDEMSALLCQMMQATLSPEMISALLVGLRVKKETVQEITGAAKALRAFVSPVTIADRRHLVDIVGTGGDCSATFNISTAAMFVAAAAGARVAKHGNRSVSSRSGSADVLEALGVVIDLPPDAVAVALQASGIGFMFAPIHHPAMRAVANIRRQLKIRTLFNILGPLTNPCSAPSIVLGVFHPDLVTVVAQVLRNLGVNKALVVWGKDGMDELSLGASTMVCELHQGQVREYELHPEDFGLAMASHRQFQVQNPAQSCQIVLDVLAGCPGPAQDIVVFNAGAALYVAEVASSIADGIERARQAIQTGQANAKLQEYRKVAQQIARGNDVCQSSSDLG